MAVASMNSGNEAGGTSNAQAVSNLTSPPPIHPRRQQNQAAANTSPPPARTELKRPSTAFSPSPNTATDSETSLGTVRTATSCAAANSNAVAAANRIIDCGKARSLIELQDLIL